MSLVGYGHEKGEVRAAAMTAGLLLSYQYTSIQLSEPARAARTPSPHRRAEKQPDHTSTVKELR